MNIAKKAWKRTGVAVLVPIMSLSLVHENALAVTEPGIVTNSFFYAEEAVSDSSLFITLSEDRVGHQPNPDEVQFTQEEAVEKLRTLFPILRQAEVSRVELGVHNEYPPPENQMVWDISWQYHQGNRGFGFSGRIDAITGDLYSIHLYGLLREENEVYYPPKFTREAARQKAIDFIKEAVPSLAAEDLTAVEDHRFDGDSALFGPIHYRFQYQLTVNGIPTPDVIYLTLDGNGNVLEFYRNLGRSEYPDFEPAISLEEAKQRYADNLQLRLQLVSQRYHQDAPIFLGWMPTGDTPLAMIDALSGELLTYDGEVISKPGSTYEPIPDTGESFVPLDLEDGEMISVEQAVAIVEKVVKLPTHKKVMSSSRGTYWKNNREVWNLEWRDEEGWRQGLLEQVSAIVDARTGQILEYREDNFNDPWGTGSFPDSSEAMEQEGNLSEEELEQIGFALLHKLYPNAQAELKWVNQATQDPYLAAGNNFSIQFQRFYQGIPVQYDTVYIVLNRDGTLVHYGFNRTDNLEERVQNLEVKVSEEEAKRKYIEDTSFELRYQYFYDYSAAEPNQQTIKLIYAQSLNNEPYLGHVLDALTGEWQATYEQQFTKKEMEELADVDGHWAEEALRTLVQFGVIIPDQSGNVYPEQTITRGEWLQMMVHAVNPYFNRISGSNVNLEDYGIAQDNPYYFAVQEGLSYQWLDPADKNLRLNDALTREDLAVFLTRILGYNKLASYIGQEQELAVYADRKEIKELGAVFLVEQLGLLKRENGLFSPQAEVNRAEAAATIMQLVYLQGKTDQVIGGYRY